MSKKPASLTSDLLARKGEAEPSPVDPAARMTLSAGPDFPPYGGGQGEGRPRPPEPEIIYTAEETRSGGGNARLIIGAVLGLIVIGGILLTLSSKTDRGVAPVAPDITAQTPAPAEPSAQTEPAPATPPAAQSVPAEPETPTAQMPSTPAPAESAPATPAAPEAAPQAATVSPAAPAPENPVSAAPEPTPAPAEEAAPAEKPVAVAKPSAKGAYVIQLQALRDEKSARASWVRLTKKYAVLGGHALDIEKASLGDKGIWYRVRAAGFETKAAAASACAKLKAAGQDCMVKKR